MAVNIAARHCSSNTAASSSVNAGSNLGRRRRRERNSFRCGLRRCCSRGHGRHDSRGARSAGGFTLVRARPCPGAMCVPDRTSPVLSVRVVLCALPVDEVEEYVIPWVIRSGSWGDHCAYESGV